MLCRQLCYLSCSNYSIYCPVSRVVGRIYWPNSRSRCTRAMPAKVPAASGWIYRRRRGFAVPFVTQIIIYECLAKRRPGPIPDEIQSQPVDCTPDAWHPHSRAYRFAPLTPFPGGREGVIAHTAHHRRHRIEKQDNRIRPESEHAAAHQQNQQDSREQQTQRALSFQSTHLLQDQRCGLRQQQVQITGSVSPAPGLSSKQPAENTWLGPSLKMCPL